MRTLLLATVAAAALAPATASAAPLRSGSVTLSFDNAYGLSLVQLGISPRVIAPATQDGVAFTLPVRKGRTGPRAIARTRGGFDLNDDAQGQALRLSNISASVRGRKVTLRGFATLGGSPYNTFAFAEGRARSVEQTAGGLKARGVVLRMTDIGATSLNTFFFTERFKTGAVMGTARISAGTAAR